MEELIASMTAEGPPAKRPPHIVFAAASPGGFPAGPGSLSSVAEFVRVTRKPPMRLSAVGALLYGLAAFGANAAADGLSAEHRAALEALRQGEMKKLVVHEEARPAIEVAFRDGDGSELTFADFEGKVALVNLWATWCPPCRAEMPSIDRLAAEMAGGDLAVIALSTDRLGPEKIAAFFNEIGVETLAVYQDKRSEVARAAGAAGLPVTMILDREGREVARLTGDADWHSAEAKAFLSRLIELTGPGA
jgi:thiol-disulfide isomerase/thioredoxin